MKVTLPEIEKIRKIAERRLNSILKEYPSNLDEYDREYIIEDFLRKFIRNKSKGR